MNGYIFGFRMPLGCSRWSTTRVGSVKPPTACHVFTRHLSHDRKHGFAVVDVRTSTIITKSVTEDAWIPSMESVDEASSTLIDRHLQLFAKADTSGDGVLNKEELRGVLESVGNGLESIDIHWLTDSDLDSIMKQYDSDGNGVIDFDEFKRLVQDNVFLTLALRDYKELFDTLDTDGNGTIGPTELYNFLNKKIEAPEESPDIGSYENVVSVMDKYDLNNDGLIDFPEFLRLCRYQKVLPIEDILQYASITPTPVTEMCSSTVEDTEARMSRESGKVHIVSSAEDFCKIIHEEKDRVIVLFASLTWCRPCKKVQPQYEKICAQYKDALFLKVCGNENESTKFLFKEELKVRVTPSFFIFKNKKLLDSCTGASATKVEMMLRKTLEQENNGAPINVTCLYP
jgi:Ca2+-binding EF-hand superfamily protein/thiol-disulfide isomerase/thioredoxin